MTIEFDATYSVEDNKLRLYASERLDPELYSRIKKAGFIFAPKQALFVAPKWTPAREDLCIELAGEITAEQSTMVERAEAKAERLEGIAARREQQSNAFYTAAEAISRRFEFGQPILVGHHSERRARKDKERMESAMKKSVELHNSIQYWNWKATGVERHANQKANPRTRANRIKGLLKDLRDCQRNINHAQLCVKLWEDIEKIESVEQFNKAVETLAGSRLETGSPAGWDDYNDVISGKIEHRALVEKLIDRWDAYRHSEHNQRWISHTLNRLAYERNELDEVPRFEGELTPVILQGFAREHGAHKPTAYKTQTGYILESSVDLPAHIAVGTTLELDGDSWRDLMQSAGYRVVIAVRRKSTRLKAPPLINPTLEDAQRLQELWTAVATAHHSNAYNQPFTCHDVIQISQERYTANSGGTYSRCVTVELDEQGRKIRTSYKGKSAEPVCRIRVFQGSRQGVSMYSPDAIFVITDKPQKALPVSFDIAVPEVMA